RRARQLARRRELEAEQAAYRIEVEAAATVARRQPQSQPAGYPPVQREEDDDYGYADHGWQRVVGQ
ncbi:MAG: hypothetical protein ABIM89_05445, partial [Mycobacteriales bacterium]